LSLHYLQYYMWNSGGLKVASKPALHLREPKNDFVSIQSQSTLSTCTNQHNLNFAEISGAMIPKAM
jgi:hypothetical protein